MKVKKFLYAGLYAVFASFAAVSLTACSSDDDGDPYVGPNAGNMTVNVDSVSETTVTASWSDVGLEGSYYTYQVTTADTVPVKTGQIQDLSTTVKNLEPGTEYIFFVYVIGGYTSQTFTTAGAKKLNASYDRTNLTPDYVSVSWKAYKEGYTYNYEVVDADSNVVKSGSTEKTSVILHGLEAGTAYTFNVVTPDGKAESSVAITIPNVAATFTADLSAYAFNGENWTGVSSAERTLVAYSNNTYTLLAWCGVEGTNLNLIQTGNKAYSVLSDVEKETDEEGYEYFYVATGLQGEGEWIIPAGCEVTNQYGAFDFYMGNYLYEIYWE